MSLCFDLFAEVITEACTFFTVGFAFWLLVRIVMSNIFVYLYALRLENENKMADHDKMVICALNYLSGASLFRLGVCKNVVNKNSPKFTEMLSTDISSHNDKKRQKRSHLKSISELHALPLAIAAVKLRKEWQRFEQSMREGSVFWGGSSLSSDQPLDEADSETYSGKSKKRH